MKTTRHNLPMMMAVVGGLLIAGLVLVLALASGTSAVSLGSSSPSASSAKARTIGSSSESAPSARAVAPGLSSRPVAGKGGPLNAPCQDTALCGERLLVPIGQDFLVAQGTADFLRPTAAGSMVVWYAQGADGMDIYGVHVGEDGSPDGKPLLIVGGAGDQTVPAIAVNSKGSVYLVVWQDRKESGTHIYATYLSADGRPQGDPFAVVTAEGEQQRPSVAYVPSADVFIVAWQDSRAGSMPDVYARVVPSSSGSPLGQEFVVVDALGSHLIPAVACDSGQPICLIVWQDDRDQALRGTDVYGRLVNATSGAVTGGEIPIAVEPEYQFSPEVVFNPVNAEYMVVWNDNISAQRVSRTGQLLGERIPVSRESPYQYKPTVAVAPDGNYLVVWEDLRDVTKSTTKVYGQRLSANGALAGPNFALTPDMHNEYSPALTFGQRGTTGAFFAVWEDARESSGRLAVYGEWLSRAGGGQ